MKIPTLPPTASLPPMITFAEGGPCEKGETAAKTGCTPAGGGGGKDAGEDAGEVSRLEDEWRSEAPTRKDLSMERLQSLEDKYGAIEGPYPGMGLRDLSTIRGRLWKHYQRDHADLKSMEGVDPAPPWKGETQKRYDRNLERIEAIDQVVGFRRAIDAEKRKIKALEEVEETGRISIDENEISELMGNVGDVYADAGIIRKGGSSRGIYSPEHFRVSDLSGKKIRRYVTLPDGRVGHPDEIHQARKRGRVVIVPPSSDADVLIPIGRPLKPFDPEI